MSSNIPRSKIPLAAESVLREVEERVGKTGEKQHEELLSLHSIFGVVLQRSLDILEKYNTLVSYVTTNKQRSLIEICGENDRFYRLFPRVNFCPCRAFKHQVLDRKSQRNMDEGTSQFYFTASMDSGKILCSLLKAIQFQESAVFCALPEGLKLTVEEGKCVQASAYVPSDNFTEYHVREDPLQLHNVMTDCEIATQTADSVLELRDEDTNEVAKMVLKAPAFLGLLADIERSCDTIELNLTPDHPNVSIVTYGMQTWCKASAANIQSR
ncbi:Checkpoint protein [Operophtera brumata]|uniref:Checkpoint protein n=1 Tax=Operophtera brumata TaxID=104452 RepID=A0A0L7LB02_OPEBR|nr:Checkpoint protein [Operophtera brumata]